MSNPPMGLNGVGIAPATSEDWVRVRDVRIRALADAPFAFGSRLEEEQDRPESVWRASLERQAAATFLAIDGDETVGLVRTFVEPEDVTTGGTRLDVGRTSHEGPRRRTPTRRSRSRVGTTPRRDQASNQNAGSE
jgi:hypothetical protein